MPPIGVRDGQGEEEKTVGLETSIHESMRGRPRKRNEGPAGTGSVREGEHQSEGRRERDPIACKNNEPASLSPRLTTHAAIEYQARSQNGLLDEHR